MKQYKPFASLLLTTLILFSACINKIPGDEDTLPDSPFNSLLNIATRTSADGGLPIFPIHIYAFGQSDNCVATQIIAEAKENIALEVAAGAYTIHVLAGASAEQYIFPALSNTLPSTVIPLRDSNNQHAELEAGSKTVTLKEGETTHLDITVTRIITEITACVTGFPDEVTSVALTLTPLHGNMRLNGTYADLSSVSTRIPLIRQADGAWCTANPVFILPSSESVTITIHTIINSTPKDYIYNTDVRVEPNNKITIQPHYNEATGNITLTGSIQSTDWAGQTNIPFDFGPGNSNGNGLLPAVGDTYRGCYVLAVTRLSTTSASVLLVSPYQWNSQKSDIIQASINSYETDGLTGWSLPNRAQAELLFQAASFVPGMDKSQFYLFTDGEILRCFYFEDANFQSQKATTSGWFNARGVMLVDIDFKM